MHGVPAGNIRDTQVTVDELADAQPHRRRHDLHRDVRDRGADLYRIFRKILRRSSEVYSLVGMRRTNQLLNIGTY